MKISVIHASRSRAKQAFDTYSKWVSNAAGDFEYILSLDSDSCRDYYVMFFYVDNVIKICHRSNNSAVEAINHGAKFATGNIFVVISDDTDCPENWDKLLLEALDGKSGFCAKTDDGLQRTLITMPIMDRVFYEKQGYVYYPEYKHMFVDQELTSVALMTGKYLKLDLLFAHNHYSTGKTLKDGLNVRNDMTWKQGEKLFNERLKTNFGIAEPVVQYSEIQWR